MERKIKEIAILGGSFNPIHYGHLFLAEFIRDYYKFNEILFIPSADPPHKIINVSALDRYNMVKLAIEDNDLFSISDIEMKNKGKSYTYKTVEAIKKETNANVYFIIGSDNLYQIHTWKHPDKIIENAEFILVNRQNYKIDENLILQYKIKRIIEMPVIDISSTEIRERIKLGKSIKYFLPDKVIDYIKFNKLYL